MEGPIFIKGNNQNDFSQDAEYGIPAIIYAATNKDLEAKWDLFKRRFEKNRFFIPAEDELISEYLHQIVFGDEPRKIASGETFYRARINENPEKPFEINDLKAPPKEVANYGRLNPKNIPYLYMSEDATTVLAEVRPYIGATVEIAKCALLREIKIIDLTKSDNDDERTNNFRKKLSELFSVPYSPRDTEKEYLPTQFIAEYIKENGFDGVMYKSAVNKGGVNICLFDTEIVEISLFDVKKVGLIEYHCTK